MSASDNGECTDGAVARDITSYIKVDKAGGWRKKVATVTMDSTSRLLTALEKLNENICISFDPLVLLPRDINDSGVSLNADLWRRK